MDKKTVLILGGAGSLGSAVSDRFIKQGCNVIIADKEEPKTTCNDYWAVDLSLGYQLREAYREWQWENTNQIDLVINAAATVYGVLGFHKNGGKILINDLLIQGHALELTRIINARFAYISSSMVYERGYEENQGYNVEIPEKDSVESYHTESYYVNVADCWQDYELKAPKTDYGFSKYTGEQMTKSYCKSHNIPYTIWRPFNVITPYEIAGKEPGIAHVFADFIRKLIIEPDISLIDNPLSYSNDIKNYSKVWQYKVDIIGTGNQVRCFTWIHDVADGIVNNSFNEEIKNQTFNLGRHEPVTMRDLIEFIFVEGKRQKIIPVDAVWNFGQVKSAPADDVRYRVPVCTKALKVLDWEASTTLRRSIAACVAEAAKNAKKHEVIKSPLGWYNPTGAVGSAGTTAV